MLRRLLSLVLFTVLVAGCTGSSNPLAMLRGRPPVQSEIITTSALEPPVRPDDCYLDMVFDRNPVRPYVVIGRVSTTWIGTDEQGLDAMESSAMTPLRSAACRAGGHVLFQYDATQRDQWVPRSGGGEAAPRGSFARAIHASALVAVYVSRDGSVLSPPSGAHRVIRVPAALTPGPDAEAEGGIHPSWEPGITDPWAVPAP
jgi:hypothetical protein